MARDEIEQFLIDEEDDLFNDEAMSRVYHTREEVVAMLEETFKQAQLKFRRQGEMIQNMEFAKLMLKDGEPLEKIKRYTGLSADVIKRLKAEMR